MQNKKKILNSTVNRPKIFYAIGIGLTLLFSLGHIAYAFIEFERLDEQVLWFLSGALAVLFNAGLNVLCFYECNKQNYVIAILANFALLIFSIFLVFVTEEIQTFCFAVVVVYTTLICYATNKNTV